MYTGCKVSKTDLRDYKIKAKTTGATFPESFQLTTPQRVKSQGQVGSCVAHATSSILEYHTNGEQKLSTNFIYGFNDSASSGMYLRDACNIAKKYGDALEVECSGNYEVPIAHKKFKESENDEMYEKAYEFRIDSYYSCTTNDDIKYAIMNYGPVLAAIKWFDSYKTDTKGNITMNLNSDYGSHAIVIYGWDATGFWCQNSWGTHFGRGGFFHISYDQNLIQEARALVDHVDENDTAIVIPKTNAALSLIYKILSNLLDVIKKLQNS